MGFRTWITSVRELASTYDVPLGNELTEHGFKLVCVNSLERTSISEWVNEISDINKFPSLRTYRIFKTKYQLEPDLYLVKNPKYRMAISKLRSSSHILEIERGRHTRPITPLENRLCPSCKVVETEIHFLLECPMYECYRKELFSKILSVGSYVKEMFPINKFYLSDDFK